MMINPKEQGEPRIAGNQALVTPKLAFVFPGTGPEWWAMGRQLLQEEPTFLNKIQECDALFRKHVDWSLWDELTAEEHESRIKSTQIAQPAIFALQVALATLWRSWGIEPDVAVGQSLGEVAAAHVAGVLSLQDAVQVIFHRSRLQATTAGQGKTLSVGLSEQEADLVRADYAEKVCISCVNSPNQVSLAGDADALEQIAHLLTQKEVSNRFWHFDVPYHSPKMDAIMPELMASLHDMTPKPAAIPLFSTVTGEVVHGSELDGTYWAQNIRQTVRIADAMANMIESEVNIFLEIGPHPILAAPIKHCLNQARKRGIVLASLRRKQPEWEVLLGSLTELDMLGYPVDWTRLYPYLSNEVRKQVAL